MEPHRYTFGMVEKMKVNTKKRTEMVDITAEIKKIVGKVKMEQGLIHVYCPHTTAAITVNENYDASVQRDISETLSSLIPHHSSYAHTEGNADAHIKSAIVGSSRTIFIQGGEVCLGTWQGIYFCEFDGPRTREVWIKFVRT
jgi:secondary thiamine-phosphate synthase enzyme